MSYQVLARKWRPASFEQMVGQEHVLQALVNALDSGRLHHAYLFSGTRGVGKTTVARIFAKALNCERGVGANPCGECSSCAEVDQGRSVDLLEIDAASRTGVDDMRELLDNVQYAPTRSRFKLYLIDEVHMLSKHSFNALLKTLEEPPPHVKFLLATTDPQKVPVTVLSRCLQFHLKRLSRSQIQEQLRFLMGEEGVEAEEAALARLAVAADGSLRDALSLTDQAIGYGGGAVAAATVEAMLGAISRDYLLRLLDALRERDAPTLLAEARAVIDNHPDYQRICAELILLVQQVALFQVDPQLADGDSAPAEAVAALAAAWSADEVQLYYQILLQGRQDLSISPDEAAGFEMLMLRLLAFAPGDAAPDGEPFAAAPAAAGQKKKTSPSLSPPAASERASPAAVEAPPTIETPAVSGETASVPIVETPPVVARGTAAHDETAERAPGPIGPGFATGALDWTGSAYRLGLGGLAQEIVANSVLLAGDEAALRLGLAPELAELVTPVIGNEIRDALRRHLGLSLEVEFEARHPLDGETPLQAKTRRLEQERREAIAAIRRDDAVRRLERAFAAELDENSVVRQAAPTAEEVR